MVRFFSLIAVITLIALPVSASEDISKQALSRADGSELTYYLSVPKEDHFPLIVYFQENRCVSSWADFQEYRSTVAALGAGLVVVEERGLSRGGFWNHLGFCPREYKDFNSLGDRMLDVLQVLQTLRVKLRGWDHRAVFIGEGDGGLVAVQLVPMIPEIQALVLMASGGGLLSTEELILTKEKDLHRKGASEADLIRADEELKQRFRVILDKPESRTRWFGRTYKWWASVFASNSLSNLEHIAGPVYIAHGTEDARVPVESSDHIAERYKFLNLTNLTYARYEGLDHHWRDPHGSDQKGKVVGDMLEWIRSQLEAPQKPN